MITLEDFSVVDSSKQMKVRKIGLLLIGWMICQSNMAKGFLSHDVDKYNFLVDSLHSIVYPDSIDLSFRDHFFDKLDSIVLCRKGKLNILHIGGSHVQADWLSHTVRCHLDSVNDDFKPARGLFFPYKTAKTNNPTNYKIYSKGIWLSSRNLKRERIAQLGATGMAVTTSDEAAEIKVCLDVDSSQRWNFTRIRLLGYGDSLCRPIMMGNDTTKFLPLWNKESESYLFQFDQPCDSFILRIEQLDTVPHSFTVNGFIAENDEEGVVYHSIGVNGASVPSYLSCENFERDLQWIKPDLVIFGIGINDAITTHFSEQKFIANYDSLITKFNRINPDCFYIFITNNDSYRRVRKNRKIRYEVNQNGLAVEHAFYTLAQNHNGGYWDLFGWMGGLESMKTWEQNGLAQKDKVHFTKKGYKLIGDTFYNALMSSYLKKE